MRLLWRMRHQAASRFRQMGFAEGGSGYGAAIIR
jgi:hypothetical protein